jgi:hypothetical protein
MDAMPVGDPLLPWPLKRTEKVNIERAMNRYVAGRHGRARKEELGPALLRMSDMRNMVEEAPAAKDVDERYIKAHYLYCALLTYAAQHFPFGDGTLGVTWTWCDTDGRRKCQSYVPTLELSAVLFNAAILTCALAGQSDRSRNGVLQAKQMYQVAAGLFDAVRLRLAAEPGGLSVTPDLSPAALSTLTKQCLCHALHMHYLADLLNSAPADWLARLAIDVAQAYSALVNALCNPLLKDSVPRDQIHQSELYCQLFEARAHIHAATALHPHQRYAEEVARLERARELLKAAGRAAKHLPRRCAAFLTKIEDRLAETIGGLDKISRSRSAPEAPPLDPLQGTGKILARLIALNDGFMGTVSEDPFKALPRLPIAASKASAPPASPPMAPGQDPKAVILALISRQQDRLRRAEEATRARIQAASSLQHPVVGRVRHIQAEARAAQERGCLGHLLATLAEAQSSVQPCRTQLVAVDRTLRAHRSAATDPLDRAAEGLGRSLDRWQATSDTVRREVQQHFAALGKLDIPPEQLETLLAPPREAVERRRLTHEVELGVRTALGRLDDVARKVAADAEAVDYALLEATVRDIGRRAVATADALADTVVAGAGDPTPPPPAQKEEAKQLGKALSMFEDMLITARSLVDQATALREQCALLATDAEWWGRTHVRPPPTAGAEAEAPDASRGESAENPPLAPLKRVSTLSPAEIQQQVVRLEAQYRSKELDEGEYAARLRELHSNAPAETREDSADTVAYGKIPASPTHVLKASNLVASSLVDEITPEMCETVAKLTFDLKTKQWHEEPLRVFIWDRPFDEGNLRMCFMMIIITADGMKHRYVAKRSKDEADPDETYHRDIETQALASMLAEAYNARKPPKKIHFLEAFLIRRDSRPPNPATGKPHLMHVEPYIIGDYKKYNNNCGYVSYDERNTPQAFSHFTAEHTRERYLVVDIQGVGDMYTDPQVHSSDGNRFGIGNWGREGFDKFFETHDCNALCAFLGLKPRRTKKDDGGTKAAARPPPRVNSVCGRPADLKGTSVAALGAAQSDPNLTACRAKAMELRRGHPSGSPEKNRVAS